MIDILQHVVAALLLGLQELGLSLREAIIIICSVVIMCVLWSLVGLSVMDLDASLSFIL